MFFQLAFGSDDILLEQDKVFDNLEPLADGILDAKPDFFDGTSPAQIDLHVRQELAGSIVPSIQDDVPILLNIFVEATGSERAPAVVWRQILYYGTLGARAMHQTQCYRSEPSYDGNAYTISISLHDDLLEFYITHPSPSQASTTHYYTNLLHAYCLGSSNFESFKQGLTALRNARLWARLQRRQMVEVANNRLTTANSFLPLCPEWP